MPDDEDFPDVPDRDTNALLTQMRADAAFMTWLETYLPTWESEYTGNILAMHAAWKAGREEQRTDDLSNWDDQD